MADHDQQPQVTDPSHQDKDINLRIVTIALIAILVPAVLSAIAMSGLFNVYKKNMYEARQTRSPLGGQERVLPQEPLLQVNEALDLAEHLQNENQLINNYSSIDKDRARIPIERAMEIVAQQGFKAKTAPAAGESKPEPAKEAPVKEEPKPEAVAADAP